MSRHREPCFGNSKLGRTTKIHGQRLGPCSPCKMPQQQSRKMSRHLRTPCKGTERPGPHKMRGQRSGTFRSPKRGSGGTRGWRSGLNGMPEHRNSLCRTPRHHRSYKASVCANRSSRQRPDWSQEQPSRSKVGQRAPDFRLKTAVRSARLHFPTRQGNVDSRRDGKLVPCWVQHAVQPRHYSCRRHSNMEGEQWRLFLRDQL